MTQKFPIKKIEINSVDSNGNKYNKIHYAAFKDNVLSNDFINDKNIYNKVIASTAKIEGVLQLDRKPFDNYGKVDVEKLALEKYPIKSYSDNDIEISDLYEEDRKIWIEGRNSAPSKEFTREQMESAIDFGHHLSDNSIIGKTTGLLSYFEARKNFIDSLTPQPTHIELEMEEVKVLKNGYTNQPDGTIGFVIAYDYKLKPKHENGIIKNFKLI